MNNKGFAKGYLSILVFAIVWASFPIARPVFGQSPELLKMLDQKELRLIAHAGGEIYGIRLTNSMQAMDLSYDKGFRLFEADFNWTSDGIPVLIHDWGNSNWFMDIRYSAKPPPYADFMRNKAILGLRFMDLELLERWLSRHKDAVIISDVKEENLKLLRIIRDKYPGIFTRLLPQIYSFEEYASVKELGYGEIMLTLYQLHKSDGEIIEFVRKYPLFGVTIYSKRVNSTLLQGLNSTGAKIYIHTVNDYNEYIKFRDTGVFGVFTDYFEPCNWVE